MKNGCMKKGIKGCWFVILIALCLIPWTTGKAEEIPAFENGSIVEIENQEAVSFLQNHTETSFEVNCDKKEIIQYLEELLNDFFTCRVVENEITYTGIPLSVEFDLSDFDTASTEKQEVLIHFVTAEGLHFSEACESSFTMQFQLRAAQEESVEIDYFPEEMTYKRNWLTSVQTEEESQNAIAQLRTQIANAFGAAYGLSSDVDLYDGVWLEVEEIDLSAVDVTKAGAYPVKIRLRINEEQEEAFFLSEENAVVETNVYVSEDSRQIYKIGEMISGYTIFSWTGEKTKKVQVYCAQTDTELTREELEQADFKLYSSENYWLDDQEQFPLFYINNAPLQKDKYYYMYLTDGKEKSQYFRLKKEQDGVEFKSYEGNRDGGDVEEENPRLEIKVPEKAEQVKAEQKETNAVGNQSSLSGEYTATDHGVTVSVPATTAENEKNAEEKSSLNLYVKHTKNGKVSIQATKQDGSVVEKLPGAKIRVPYPDTGEETVLNVTNKRGDTVAKAEYRKEQGVAEFEVDEPGTYEIQSAAQSESVPSQGKQMYHWIFYAALAAVMAVITGGTTMGVWRHRKHREK